MFLRHTGPVVSQAHEPRLFCSAEFCNLAPYSVVGRCGICRYPVLRRMAVVLQNLANNTTSSHRLFAPSRPAAPPLSPRSKVRPRYAALLPADEPPSETHSSSNELCHRVSRTICNGLQSMCVHTYTPAEIGELTADDRGPCPLLCQPPRYVTARTAPQHSTAKPGRARRRNAEPSRLAGRDRGARDWGREDV